MEIKTIKTATTLGFKMKTTLANMMQEVGEKPATLMQEAQKLGLQIVGAQVWVYEGCDGNVESEFDLTVTIPIAEKKGEPEYGFSYIDLPEFKCAITIHNGPYSEFGDVYCKFMAEIAQAGKEYIGSSREVYLNCDFEDQSKCVTEIQVGIQ